MYRVHTGLMARAPGGTPAQRRMLAALNDRPDDEFVYTVGQITAAIRLKLAPAIPNQDDWQVPDGWAKHFAAVISTRSWWNFGRADRDPNLMLLFLVAEGDSLLPEYADKVLRQHLCDYIDALVPRELHNASEEARSQWIREQTDVQRAQYLASNDRAKHSLHPRVSDHKDYLRQIRGLRRDYLRRTNLTLQQLREAIENAGRHFPLSKRFWSDSDLASNNAQGIWEAVTDSVLENQAIENAVASRMYEMELRFSNPLETLLTAAWRNDRPELLAVGTLNTESFRDTLKDRNSVNPRSWYRNRGTEEYTWWVEAFDRDSSNLLADQAFTSALMQPPLIFIRDFLAAGPIFPEVLQEFRAAVQGDLTDIRQQPETHGILASRFFKSYTAPFVKAALSDDVLHTRPMPSGLQSADTTRSPK